MSRACGKFKRISDGRQPVGAVVVVPFDAVVN
jgi:hypothetical protein